MTRKLQLHFSASALLLFYAFTGRFADYIVIILSVVLHECGHLVAARLVGVKVESVRFYVYGAHMRFQTSLLTAYQQLVIASGGPIMTVIVLLLFSAESQISYGQVVQMQIFLLLINLCPIWPLDGGRIVQALLGVFFQSTNVEVIFLRLSLVLASIAVVISIFLLKPFFTLVFTVVCQQIVMELKELPIRSAYKRIVLNRS